MQMDKKISFILLSPKMFPSWHSPELIILANVFEFSTYPRNYVKHFTYLTHFIFSIPCKVPISLFSYKKN
jgi:hypothetical protein